jgi:hypothetical protein
MRHGAIWFTIQVKGIEMKKPEIINVWIDKKTGELKAETMGKKPIGEILFNGWLGYFFGFLVGMLVVLLFAFLSASCIRMPDIIRAQELAEKVQTTVRCQQIASACIKIVASVDRGNVTQDDLMSVQLCADRWEANGCATIVDELMLEAGAFFDERE